MSVDLTKRIIFQNDEGGVSVLIPADCGLTLEQIAAKDVPAGRPYKIVDMSDIPSDRSERIAWTVDGRMTIKIDASRLPVPESVTAGQFHMQLNKPLPSFPNGVRDEVRQYVSTLPQEHQDAFEYSGTFSRNEPMMQAGFEAMGFAPEQIDAFFLAASKL